MGKIIKIKEVKRLEGRIVMEDGWVYVETPAGERIHFNLRDFRENGLWVDDEVTFVLSSPDKDGRIWANRVWSKRLDTFVSRR